MLNNIGGIVIKKALKGLGYVLLGVLLGSAIYFAKEAVTSEINLKTMRNKLTSQYYDEAKLKAAMEHKLGEAYSGNPIDDFENFTLKLVTDHLSEHEMGKKKGYNLFLSSDEMNELVKEWKEEASGTYGRSLGANIYYLVIEQFYGNETYDRVKSLVSEMEKHDRLIIDLRNNSGGYMDSLEDVASLFLPKDKIIYSAKSSKAIEHHYSTNKNPLQFEKIILLVNGGTASAAEALTLALKENLDYVTVIGEKTYGKDFILSIKQFNDKSGFIFISSTIVSPNETEYGEGIEPDIHIAIDSNEQISKDMESDDIDLNKALQLLELSSSKN